MCNFLFQNNDSLDELLKSFLMDELEPGTGDQSSEGERGLGRVESSISARGVSDSIRRGMSPPKTHRSINHRGLSGVLGRMESSISVRGISVSIRWGMSLPKT